MFLEKLYLKNFRSFREKSFSFSPKVSLVVGANTAGKTNLLEAIYLLATGKSFRADIEKEMISYGEEISRVEGNISQNTQKTQTTRGSEDQIIGILKNSDISDNPMSRRSEYSEFSKLEIVLTTGTVGNQPAPFKRYLLNDVPKRMLDFVGNLKAVLFWPQDMELVTDSPSVRRKYLDLVLCQVDREYRRALISYEKGLRQRNKLLERIRDEGASRLQLSFWDKLIIKNGSYLTEQRAQFIDYVNNFHLLFPPVGGVHLHFHLEYDKSVISENRLAQYSQEEVAAATTLVGPHRDDMIFKILPNPNTTNNTNERDISIYGSRGEQRLAILWLKLAELEFIAQKTGERPILLLDDIFSELDHEHRDYVIKVIPQQQTIITTTDLHMVEKTYQEKVEVIQL